MKSEEVDARISVADTEETKKQNNKELEGENLKRYPDSFA